METVGESLKNARKYQKIDLNTASQNLNISQNIDFLNINYEL